MVSRFLASIKNALECLTSVNDKRNSGFPLNLKNSLSSISRLSAYLHLFHHQVRDPLRMRYSLRGALTRTLQCIVLTIRPLLSLWQERAEMSKALRVSSAGNVRSLLRVCVASAHETLKILAALQAQSLLGAYIPRRCTSFVDRALDQIPCLESFIPFDLEPVCSCAVVLLVTEMVDPSLVRKNESWLEKIYLFLDKMAFRGNLIAGVRKAELQKLDETLTRLHTSSTS